MRIGRKLWVWLSKRWRKAVFRRLELKEGDILVIKIDQYLSSAAEARVRKMCEVFTEGRNQVVIIPKSFDFEVISSTGVTKPVVLVACPHGLKKPDK